MAAGREPLPPSRRGMHIIILCAHPEAWVAGVPGAVRGGMNNHCAFQGGHTGRGAECGDAASMRAEQRVREPPGRDAHRAAREQTCSVVRGLKEMFRFLAS